LSKNVVAAMLQREWRTGSGGGSSYQQSQKKKKNLSTTVLEPL